jgi:hypothetical protein
MRLPSSRNPFTIACEPVGSNEHLGMSATHPPIANVWRFRLGRHSARPPPLSAQATNKTTSTLATEALTARERPHRLRD